MGSELESAWQLREKLGVFSESEAVRVFHGPSEGVSESALRGIAIDRFGEHYWVTEWATESKSRNELSIVSDFLQSHGARSAVHFFRPLASAPKGAPKSAPKSTHEKPEILFGEPPSGRFPVREGSATFLIQLVGTQHPGLFLDHAPLRHWLRENMRGRAVLNTFAYTGSLSVSAGLGGAKSVTTLDLSKPTLEWAKENWAMNKLPAARGEFVFGDYFDWMARFERKKKLFDCVIIDPPSFSRGPKGSFSTAKDLGRLHELAFGVLARGGILVTSINSSNVTRKKYFYEIHTAAKTRSRELKILHEIELPPTFPARSEAAHSESDRYLKGWILQCG